MQCIAASREQILKKSENQNDLYPKIEQYRAHRSISRVRIHIKKYFPKKYSRR